MIKTYFSNLNNFFLMIYVIYWFSFTDSIFVFINFCLICLPSPLSFCSTTFSFSLLPIFRLKLLLSILLWVEPKESRRLNEP